MMSARAVMVSSEADSAETEPARPVRVLVVDDHEVVREGMSAALGADGQFEVVAAVATASAALQAATRTRPDVALVDLRLPDLMGDRLCAELRRRLPATAVVVLSSYVSEDTVRTAMEAGAAAYITKAAGLAELRKALLDVVGADEGSSRTTDRRSAPRTRLSAHRRQPAHAPARAGARAVGRGFDLSRDRRSPVHLGIDRSFPHAEAQVEVRRSHEDRARCARDPLWRDGTGGRGARLLVVIRLLHADRHRAGASDGGPRGRRPTRASRRRRTRRRAVSRRGPAHPQRRRPVRC